MQNNQPIMGVGALVIHLNKVLLIKRAKPPNQNQWAIPGGKVKFGETLQQAAEREIREETNITIKAGEPLFTFEHIDRDDTGNALCHFIVIDLRAEYISGTVAALSDAADARWFDKAALSVLNDINVVTQKLLRKTGFL